jgi:methylated-DNA-protein-cysteine methyltransferase related protein
MKKQNSIITSPFKKMVIDLVRIIPPGKVMSYGQIALHMGTPRAARQVGWTLRQIGTETTIPWWRVINQKGRISIDGNLHADKQLQRKLLEAEGVEVSNEYQVEMEKYRFIPKNQLINQLSNQQINKYIG